MRCLIRNRFVTFTLIASLLLLSGCVTYRGSAPVRDINTIRIGHVLYYVVQPGETLYSVAWRNEMDFVQLAAINHLKSPYAIYPGQKLRLSGPVPRAIVQSVARQSARFHPTRFRWPTKGRVVGRFSGLDRGIDIAGRYGQPILASDSGQVVYAGNGLAAYGNLLIIKHNRIFLSAYAHNAKLFVRTGQSVKQGQKIATMGTNNRGEVFLHFEIRRYGKPVDPLQCIGVRSTKITH